MKRAAAALAAIPAAAAAIALTACGSGAHHPSPSSTASAAPTPSGSVAPTTSTTTQRPARSPGPGAVPAFAHIVVVMLENHAYSDIIGQPDAPYLNSLAASGALMTQSYAIAHPSEPNYLALFSGSTQGVSDDSCPDEFSGPNLATALAAHGLSFVGYSEGLPQPGYTGCSAGEYARKHNPWVDFSSLPSADNQPMTAFPTDFDTLPTVAFVVPDLLDDMHDGTVAEADSWLHNHLAGYASWALGHDSLLIITTDEDDGGHGNQITTILVGAHLRPGRYGQRVDHYGVLHTILDSVGVAPIGAAQTSPAMTAIWAPTA